MPNSIHVSLVAIPEASISTLHGLYDVLTSFGLLKHLDDTIPEYSPFKVEIVAAQSEPVMLASGIATSVHRNIADVETTDIIIVPSLVLPSEGWQTGRHTKLVQWLEHANQNGATICSACSGVFLIAETGLLNNKDVTLHWGYAPQFQNCFPQVKIHPNQPLMTSGVRGEFISSGASMSWHDLVLHLIAQFVSPTAAQTIAKFFALQWHRDGLSPFIIFEGRFDHGDAAILEAQQWLAKNYGIANPVDEVVKRSMIAERTFKRRFLNATNFAPLAYVQQLRIEAAKRLLERTNDAIDEISWRVGYEDPAFFRRLFKRLSRMTPGNYRRQFQIPAHIMSP